MIIVQDRIAVASSDLPRLEQLFRERYRATAEQRGLHFVESLIAPPLLLQQGLSTFYQRWHVCDAGAWWVMRSQAGNPAVVAFWAEVDAFCVSRERQYLSDDDALKLPWPEDIAALQASTRGHRETAQLSLAESVSTEQKATLLEVLTTAAQQLPGLELAGAAENLAPEYAAGHITWDLLFPDSETAENARASAYWREQVAPALRRYCRACHALSLVTIGAGARRRGLNDGIKRTAFFRLLPGMDAAVAARFERDLLAMPAHIPEILNWRLSRAQTLPWNVSECEPWTYIWEQEFESLDGLTGPYMTNPYHWAHIDRWFDPESGVQAIDTDLSHAFSPFDKSVLAREMV